MSAQVIKFVSKHDKQEMQRFGELAKLGAVELRWRRPGFVQVMTPRKLPVTQGFDGPEAA